MATTLLVGCSGGSTTHTAESSVVEAEGVVLFLPEGWVLSDALTEGGVVAARPETRADERPQQFLVAGAAEHTDLPIPEGADFADGLRALYDLRGGRPAVEDDVEVEGARQARLLRYDAVSEHPAAGHGNEVVILAADHDGGLWLFTYWASLEEFDDELAAGFAERVQISASDT